MWTRRRRQRLLGWRSLGLALGLSLFGQLGCPPAATGQGQGPPLGLALYQWPTDSVDVASYGVDACLGALVRGGLSWQDRIKAPEGPGVYEDTVRFDSEHWWQKSLPPKMIATAQRCTAKFVEPKTPLDGWWLLMSLYLTANRDSDAATLFQRRLATAQNAAARKALIDSALKVYVGEQVSYHMMDLAWPRRFEAQAALLEQRAALATDKWEQLNDYGRIVNLMQQNGDTTGLRRAAQRLLTAVEALSPAERAQYFNGLPDVEIKVALFGFQQLAAGSAPSAGAMSAADQWALDSLRHSTARYAAMKQQAFQQTTGLRFPMPVGERAAPLTGDVILPAEAARAGRPTAGKVSLVVFCDHPAAELVAVLHRLIERFPALEVTVVAQGEGFFGSVAPPSLAEEAGHRHKEWTQAFYPLPVALVLTMVPKMRLPAPDRRLLRPPGYVDPNEARYSFGKTWQSNAWWRGMAFLVDQQGLIVHATNSGFGATPGLLTSRDETEFARLIEILLRRPPVAALNAP